MTTNSHTLYLTFHVALSLCLATTQNAFALIRFFVTFHCANFDRHFNWLFQFCMFVYHFVCFVWLKSRIVVTFVMLIFFSVCLCYLLFVQYTRRTLDSVSLSLGRLARVCLTVTRRLWNRPTHSICLKHNSLTVCPLSISLFDSLRYSFTRWLSGWQFIRCLCDFTHSQF